MKEGRNAEKGEERSRTLRGYEVRSVWWWGERERWRLWQGRSLESTIGIYISSITGWTT